jgi:hypothetical protein
MPDLFLQLQGDEDEREPVEPLGLSEAGALAVLAEADFTASKLIPWGSNYTFAVALICPDGREQLAIYKPSAGEAPLYDFPDGTLYRRELAAFLVSQSIGWDLVPATVVRDGPNGVGSVQLYIEPLEDRGDDRQFWGSCGLDVERLVLFDHVINNADRKIGHCLRDRQGKVWGIDHGLTFNRYPKLRTVLWQHVGAPIAPQLRDDLRRFRTRSSEIGVALGPWLADGEIDALFARVERLVERGSYPPLNPRRNVPYGWW